MSEIINMKPIIREIILQTPEITKCVTTYPNSFNDLPVVVYSTTSYPRFIDNKKEEYQTVWETTIDLIGKGSLSEIAMDICRNLAKSGFTYRKTDANIDGLSRVIIYANVLVDNNLKLSFKS